MKRLLQWLRNRREQKRLALIAEAASLVIQQRGSTWSNRTCPNCTQAVSDTANFCQMCGFSFVPELQTGCYEIERHTSSMHPIVVPPKRPNNDARISSLIRTQHQLPRFPAQTYTQSKKQQQQGN